MQAGGDPTGAGGMMHLSLKFGASGPLTIIMSLALFGGLLTAEGRKLHVIYGLPNAMFLAFFAGVAAMMFVLPNVFATLLANRFGGPETGRFIAILVVGSIAGSIGMAVALNAMSKSIGAFAVLADWRTHAAILANAVLLAMVAIMFGTRHA